MNLPIYLRVFKQAFTKFIIAFVIIKLDITVFGLFFISIIVILILVI